MKQLKNILGVAVLSIFCADLQAQERDNKGVNQLSVREINEADIMMKRTLWRRLDLKEKQNQPMFSKENEITKYILDAMKAGLLDAYTDDRLGKKMTLDDFNKKLKIPNTGATLTEEEIKAGFAEPAAGAGGDGWGDKKDAKKTTKPADDGWGTAKKDDKKATEPVDDGWGAPKKKTTKGKKGAIAKVEPKIDSTEIKRKMAEEKAAADAAVAAAAAASSDNDYFPEQLSILEIKEDWIVDRKRSRLYYDIQTITIWIPSDVTPTGIEVPLATFKFKDLDKLFRSDPKKFIWFNEYNTAQHKNLSDAFDLRLFYGRIIKYSNPLNEDLIKMYGGEKEALWKSIQTENELMELEHGLWEY
jgi:gliding motility associated protien GldN